MDGVTGDWSSFQPDQLAIDSNDQSVGAQAQSATDRQGSGKVLSLFNLR
jgi:hypothetical protein